MIERYSRKCMRDIWSEKNKFDVYLKVELLNAKAWAKLGIVPEDDLKKLDKATFDSFIPEKYKNKNSFTWDFQAETISVNHPYKAINNFMTKECFIPEVVEPMPKLEKRFDEFIKLLNMEPVNLADELRKEDPSLASWLGL